MKMFLLIFFVSFLITFVLLAILNPVSIRRIATSVPDSITSGLQQNGNEPRKFISPVPAEFYGINVEMSQLLPESDNYIVNERGEDLIDIAATLGINLFRITNETFPFGKSHAYTNTQWRTVLDKMHRNGIKAIILIESPTLYQKNIPESYLQYTKEYLIDSGVLSHRAVYGIDLYNEMLINEKNIELLTEAGQMIKKYSPDMLLTVGWWATETGELDEDGEPEFTWDNYESGKKLEPIVDFYSLHMYGMDKKKLGFYPDARNFTVNFITKVRNSLDTEKPFLIGEFGAANGETVSDQETTGNPQLQADVYEGVYRALRELDDPQILGTAAFQFISRTGKPDAWAVAKDHANYLLPAAFEIQKAAKTTD